MIAPMLLAAAASVSAPPCTAAQIRVSTDGRDGDFDGMSHGGTLLVLRNVGARACSVPGLPTVHFLDPRGRALPASRKAPIGMRPGPVVLPVTIAPGGRATTGLRWVSGPVFDHSRSIAASVIAVTIGGRQVRATASERLFGEAGRPVGFDQPPLTAGPAR